VPIDGGDGEIAAVYYRIEVDRLVLILPAQILRSIESSTADFSGEAMRSVSVLNKDVESNDAHTLLCRRCMLANPAYRFRMIGEPYEAVRVEFALKGFLK
jgi:hypothetical protein